MEDTNDHQTKSPFKGFFDRRKSAEVRNKAISIALDILNKPRVEMNAEDYSLWKETYLTILRAAVPKTMEVTGKDGEAVSIKQITGMEIKPDEESGPNQDSVQDQESKTDSSC